MITISRGKTAFMGMNASCNLRINGITYRNAQAAYQSFKLSDRTLRPVFCDMTGAEAKRAARLITVRNDWDAVRKDILKGVVRAKFRQHPDFLARLKATGAEELVDENEAETNLGEILMQVRREL